MEPTAIVALIAGAFGLAGSWLAVRNTRSIERTRAAAEAATTEVEATKTLVDGWARFAEQHRVELAEEKAVTQAFADKATRLGGEVAELRAEVEHCRKHHGEHAGG
jgi:chromosome segregation ATPase